MKKERFVELERHLKSLVPIDNDAFSYFAKDKNFCEEFLRVVLEDDNLIVLDNEPQKKLPSIYFKEAVLDMLCKLSDGRIVNVEIQLYKDEDSARRIFQYASMIRSAFVEKGTKYKDIKDIIIIYLTKEDIFHRGNTTYTVDMNVMSDTNEYVKKFDCGIRILYINTKGITKRNINEYLKLLSDSITYDKKYKATSILKNDLYKTGGNSNMSEWLTNFLKEVREEEKEEAREEGKALGIEEGREEGRAEGKTLTLTELVNKGMLSVENAAKVMNISVEKFKELVSV